MNFPHLANPEGRPLDQVQITGMLMSCVIGIFPSERSRKQPVTIDMCLYLDTRVAAKSANIGDTIDYAGALKEISFILDHCEFLLIETAVEAICRHFLLTYQTDHALPKIEAVMTRISKPSALTHGIVPSVQILRRRDDYEIAAVDLNGHALYEIHTAADACLKLLAASNSSEIDVLEHLPSARAVLPIGHWSFQGNITKSRSPIQLEAGSGQFFSSIETKTRNSRILLIQTLS